jgi:hypothetical protein
LKTKHENLRNAAKIVYRGKFIVLGGFIEKKKEKEKECQIPHLTYLKRLVKEELTNTKYKSSKRKIRAEINKIQRRENQ